MTQSFGFEATALQSNSVQNADTFPWKPLCSPFFWTFWLKPLANRRQYSYFWNQYNPINKRRPVSIFISSAILILSEHHFAIFLQFFVAEWNAKRTNFYFYNRTFKEIMTKFSESLSRNINICYCLGWIICASDNSLSLKSVSNIEKPKGEVVWFLRPHCFNNSTLHGDLSSPFTTTALQQVDLREL